MKNKLALFKLADGVEILVQDVYSSLAVIQTKEDVWLAEGAVRQGDDKHANRFNSLAAGHVHRPGGRQHHREVKTVSAALRVYFLESSHFKLF